MSKIDCKYYLHRISIKMNSIGHLKMSVFTLLLALCLWHSQIVLANQLRSNHNHLVPHRVNFSETSRSQQQQQSNDRISNEEPNGVEMVANESEATDGSDLTDSVSEDGNNSESEDGDERDATEIGALPDSPPAAIQSLQQHNPSEPHLRPSRQSSQLSGTTGGPIPTRQPASSRTMTGPTRVASTTVANIPIRATQTPQLEPATNNRGSMMVPTMLSVDMGADRMSIKPPNQDSIGQVRRQQSNIRMTTMPTIADQELATESIKHEFLTESATQTNERRQDSLYSSAGITPISTIVPDDQTTNSGRPPAGGYNYASRSNAEFESEAQMSMPSICYTPLALLMVILVTMLITIAVCLCTHLLVKHLGRHQFDLIETGKHYETKQESGYNNAATPDPARGGGSHSLNFDGAERIQPKQSSCILSLFQGREALNEHRPDGCAFDNPYFRNEIVSGHSDHLREQRSSRTSATNTIGKEMPASEQLHFIEHHISNLHNRQVTSSVKELSILDSNSASPLGRVVDLTSEEQRAKVIANPQEGDLVAVDITGHDFIGLGFDVCGNAQSGIFIKSVHSRGPARQSGCIEPGDQIKCLNVSFENITLQDAYDILNCGSPYKLRLLLEKRPISDGQVERQGSRLPLQFGSCNSKLVGSTHLDEARPSAAGPISSTKNCLRRLTNQLVSAGGAIIEPNSKGKRQKQPIDDQVYLGSAAARQKRSRDCNLDEAVSHVNAGYGSDSDHDESRPDGRNNPQLARHLSRGSGSLDSSNLDRVTSHSKVDARERSGISSANDVGSGADSSLSYQNKNSNHRLHGLQLDADQKLDSQLSSLSTTNRRQTVDTASSPLAGQLKHQQIEQTQSQPEIALKLGGETIDLDELGGVMDASRGGKSSLLANSVSTPAMNLIAVAPQMSSQVGDWRRASSRRRRKQQSTRESNISEEAGNESNQN